MNHNIIIPGTLTSKIIVNIDSTLTKDKVFDPSLEPTIDHGLAEDLFQVIDDIEGKYIK